MISNKFVSALLFLAVLLLISKPCYGSSLTSYAIEDGFYDGSVLTNSRRLDVTNTNSVDKLALLKFDITNLKNLKNTEVASVKLKLYVDTNYNDPTISAYYVSNDNWTEGKYLQSHSMTFNKTNEPANTQVTGSSINLNNNGTKWIIWDLTAINIPEFKNSDNIVTIALEDISKGSLNSNIRFFSREYCSVYAPQLIVETRATAPTPEPSSLILCLASMVGMFGLRRRK